MTIGPVWRNRISASGAAVFAVWMGAAIANNEFTWPLVLAAFMLGLAVTWVQPLSLPTVLLGGVICGYIVGNRGFAQLSPSTRLPLLPAELVLLAASAILGIKFAVRRELPWQRDILNYALLVWIVVGAGRLVFDVREFGVAALRDFAMVYYAAFFMIAQFVAREPGAVRFILGCFAGSCALLVITQPLFSEFPGIFLDVLTIRGVPVIYYKGDLAATFMAAGAVVFFIAFERTRRWRYLLGSLLLIGSCLNTNNRSSLVALAAVAILLLVAGRWRFAAFATVAGAAGAVVLLFAAYVSNKSWTQTPLHGAYERVVSMTDPFGIRQYSGADTFYKGDNNRFRSVWWSIVYEDTMATNPWLGMGFGQDLAARFLREYYQDGADDFTARSPHNVVLTVFARMGLAGLVPFLIAMSAFVWCTLQSVRSNAYIESALWCAGMIIFVSACFGVVLEGPMGAVVFWTLLGLANGHRLATVASNENQTVATDDQRLPGEAGVPEVAATT